MFLFQRPQLEYARYLMTGLLSAPVLTAPAVKRKEKKKIKEKEKKNKKAKYKRDDVRVCVRRIWTAFQHLSLCIAKKPPGLACPSCRSPTAFSSKSFIAAPTSDTLQRKRLCGRMVPDDTTIQAFIYLFISC